MNEAFINGFIKRAMAYGFTEQESIKVAEGFFDNVAKTRGDLREAPTGGLAGLIDYGMAPINAMLPGVYNSSWTKAPAATLPSTPVAPHYSPPITGLTDPSGMVAQLTQNKADVAAASKPF